MSNPYTADLNMEALDEVEQLQRSKIQQLQQQGELERLRFASSGAALADSKTKAFKHFMQETFAGGGVDASTSALAIETRKRQQRSLCDDQNNALHSNNRARIEGQEQVDISSLIADLQERQPSNYLQDASTISNMIRAQGVPFNPQNQFQSLDNMVNSNTQQAMLSGTDNHFNLSQFARQMNPAANAGLQNNLMNLASLQRANAAGSVNGSASLLEPPNNNLGHAFGAGPPVNGFLGARFPQKMQQHLLSSILDYNTAQNLLQNSSENNMQAASRAPAIGDFSQQISASNMHQLVGRAPGQAAEIGAVDSTRRAPLNALPPCDEGILLHFSQRTIVALSSSEDENWLSEFLCFVRSDLVEVFRAGKEDVASRINSKKVVHGQIGIRCRFCAHVCHSERASRSSSFPSSLSRIYQSLTMMLRDHFPRCSAIPIEQKSTFTTLKIAKTTQGATDSKRYWIDSAMKLGMVDTPQGIIVTERSQMAGMSAPPFGTSNEQALFPSLPLPLFGQQQGAYSGREAESGPAVLLIMVEDRPLVSPYLYLLMSQVQRVFLAESERVGNRKTLEVGLPGLACRHCCRTNRKGLCRLFPARRRSLPVKIKDLHDHLRRCTLCPEDIKQSLASLKDIEISDNDSLKTFYDLVWSRLYYGKARCGTSKV